MPPNHVLARDHLLRAAAILEGADNRSRQLRYIVERTISLIDDTEPAGEVPGNVLDFAAFRDRHIALD